MNLPIELVDIEERTIAAVRARIAMSDIPDRIFPLMDRVWEFIRGIPTLTISYYYSLRQKAKAGLWRQKR